MKVIITKHQSDTSTSTQGGNYTPTSHSSIAVGYDDEMVAHKKERLKNLKVIQEKADVETYGKRSHFIGRGRPMQPTMRRQHR